MPAEDEKTPTPNPLPDNTVPSMRIGRYAVARELGRGGMGIVYEATDPAIGRRVAIKVINLQFLTGAGEAQILRERLFREARSAGALSHSGIVAVYDVGEDRQMAFIAMEYVDGPNLQQVQQSGRKLQLAEVVEILRQIAAALDYAHENGVVHRDIKPPNIMLHKGSQVKIADFGIAKITTAPKYTMTGMVMGTPAYMSPEQIEGREVDGRSDQFSLAVVAYELLTGAGPFHGGTYVSMVHKIVYGPRPSAHAANPLLPAAVDPVFARAMAPRPEDRFANCAEFVAALDNALRVAAPVVAQQAPAPPARRASRLVAGVAAMLVLALVGAAATYWFWPALRGVAGHQVQEARPSAASPNAATANETPAPVIPPKENPLTPPNRTDSPSPSPNQAVPKAGAPVGTGETSTTKKPAALAEEAPAPKPAGMVPQPVAEVLPPTKRILRVMSNLAWTDTGIDLRAGDRAAIEAHGTIQIAADQRIKEQQPAGFYPDCSRAKQLFGQPVGTAPAPHLACWSLIGRVGPGGMIFEAGAHGTVPAGSAGRLFLGVNDGNYADNSGYWTAVVTVEHH